MLGGPSATPLDDDDDLLLLLLLHVVPELVDFSSLITVRVEDAFLALAEEFSPATAASLNRVGNDFAFVPMLLSERNFVALSAFFSRSLLPFKGLQDPPDFVSPSSPVFFSRFHLAFKGLIDLLGERSLWPASFSRIPLPLRGL